MERKNICVVCSGNICRSPFVEHVLRRELGDRHNVYSMGLLGIYGEPAYEVCVALGRHYGIDLSSHRSQGATAENIRQSDYFLVMTRNHRRGIEPFSPSGEVMLLSEFLPAGREFDMGALGTVSKGDDIVDPMGQSANIVQPVLEVMQTAALGFVEYLEKR